MYRFSPRRSQRATGTRSERCSLPVSASTAERLDNRNGSTDAAPESLRSQRRTLELIQVFRGAAATMVVLYHVGSINHFYSPFLGNVFGFGHSGVDFFFILSGFIMLYVHYEAARGLPSACEQRSDSWRCVQSASFRSTGACSR